MKSIATVLFIVLFCAIACAQQKPAPRLIVRGDDMGFSHSGNVALIKSSLEGIQTSIEIIVPSPWFPEAVKFLQENTGVDVGINLDITSEWDNIKWRPLSDCASLKDSNGYFFPMVFPNKNYPGQSIKENNWKIEDIEKEFRAQIEMGLKHIPRISHISSHMGCTNITDKVKALTKKLAKEYKIDIDLEDYHVERAGYEGLTKLSKKRYKAFSICLKSLRRAKHIFLLNTRE